MKIIGRVVLLTMFVSCSFGTFAQELAVDGSATIQSAKNCSGSSIDDCTVNEAETSIVWSHSNIQITRADGSVLTLPLTRQLEEETAEEGDFYRHVYSCTDLVSGTAHSFEITVYQGDLPNYDGMSYSHKVAFVDGNQEGMLTTYFGLLD